MSVTKTVVVSDPDGNALSFDYEIGSPAISAYIGGDVVELAGNDVRELLRYFEDRLSEVRAAEKLRDGGS